MQPMEWPSDERWRSTGNPGQALEQQGFSHDNLQDVIQQS
jgi:hypothetical protein